MATKKTTKPVQQAGAANPAKARGSKRVDTRGKSPDEIAKAAEALLNAEAQERAAKRPQGTRPDSSTGAAKSTREGLDEWLDDVPARERDIVTTDVQPARAFRSQEFARANIGLIDEYATYRVLGMNPERAFIRVFGTDYGDVHLYSRIEALEHNLVFRTVFAKRFGETPLSRMFSVKQAVWQWLSLLNNPFVRETVRATAIQQLQTIYGITVTDEAGNTKATKSLEDFYRDEGDSKDSTPLVRHPDPGSKEAIELEANIRGENAPAA
jgi:hypothetical protein